MRLNTSADYSLGKGRSEGSCSHLCLSAWMFP